MSKQQCNGRFEGITSERGGKSAGKQTEQCKHTTGGHEATLKDSQLN